MIDKGIEKILDKNEIANFFQAFEFLLVAGYEEISAFLTALYYYNIDDVDFENDYDFYIIDNDNYIVKLIILNDETKYLKNYISYCYTNDIPNDIPNDIQHSEIKFTFENFSLFSFITSKMNVNRIDGFLGGEDMDFGDIEDDEDECYDCFGGAWGRD